MSLPSEILNFRCRFLFRCCLHLLTRDSPRKIGTKWTRSDDTRKLWFFAAVEELFAMRTNKTDVVIYGQCKMPRLHRTLRTDYVTSHAKSSKEFAIQLLHIISVRRFMVRPKRNLLTSMRETPPGRAWMKSSRVPGTCSKMRNPISGPSTLYGSASVLPPLERLPRFATPVAGGSVPRHRTIFGCCMERASVASRCCGVNGKGYV